MRAFICALILIVYLCSEATCLKKGVLYKRRRLQDSSIKASHDNQLEVNNTTGLNITITTSKPKIPPRSANTQICTKRKRGFLKRERVKLRKLLKSKPVLENKIEINRIMKRLNHINDEFRKCRLKNVKRKKKINKAKGSPSESSSSILEVTTAANKHSVSNWTLKNNSTLQTIITKLNQDPEQSFDDRFKTQSDDYTITTGDKLHDTFPNDKLSRFNALAENSDQNLLRKSSTNSSHLSDNLNGQSKETQTTEFYDILKTTASPAAHPIKNSHAHVHGHETVKEAIKEAGEGSISKINYANLMEIKSTTMPPVKNITLNTILKEFNAISNQIEEIIPVPKKYPKLNMTRNGYESTGNRCSERKGGCEHKCHAWGAKKCSCMAGFKLVNRRKCLDIDECRLHNGGCQGICHNTPGSFYCSCEKGLRLSDDQKSCVDINECLLRNGHGPCQDTCININGSYECSCTGLNGTRLSSDRHSCEDIDECLENKGGCSHFCVNTLGRAYCMCPEGLSLGYDWKTCVDINECEDEELKKHCSYGCINTFGSYRCGNSYELQNDQQSVHDLVACPKLLPPLHGFLECTREHSLSANLRSKSGRKRVTNRPGTFCHLVCPEGYEISGIFKITCGYDGTWFGENSGYCKERSVPQIKCPASKVEYLKEDEDGVMVQFPPPKSNVDIGWITADPSWAIKLKHHLKRGKHHITFVATDPNTADYAKCSFDITIKSPI